ncbi:MAG: IS4 family transposase [Leptospiraceae bacterium]|nr:IS4 family transposase [Leptospiraceae bacterium]
MIFSTEIKSLARFKKSSFTRNRKLTLPHLIITILRTFSRSIFLEIISVCERFRIIQFTKQALSRSRENLNSEVFELLNNSFVDGYYEEDYKTYNGYILLACDGCRVSLPISDELKKDFGCLKNQSGISSHPTALTSVLYDIENEIIVSSVIKHVLSSEKQLVLDHIEKIKSFENLYGKKIIILFDRDYPSLEIISALLVNKISFIMRCSRSWLKEAKDALNYKEYDSIKEVTLKLKRNKNKNSVKEYFEKLGNRMSLRFICRKFPDGVKGIFVTNLLQVEFSSERILELYRRRWEIETHFRMEKQTAELENFASKTTNKIKQEYFAKVLLMNFTNLLIHEAMEEKKEIFENGKYKINKNIAFGIVKDKLDFLISGINSDKTIELIKDRLLRIPKITVRSNRKFPRHEKIRKRKFEMNRRRAT